MSALTIVPENPPDAVITVVPAEKCGGGRSVRREKEKRPDSEDRVAGLRAFPH